MTTIPVTLNVPKETKEVIDLLSVIADNVIAKVPFSEWVNLVDEAYAAIQGVDQVASEVKSEGKADALAYLTKTVGSKF